MARLALLTLVLALAGCGGSAVSPTECRCAAGITVACSCPGGAVGSQACRADCSDWEPCQCSGGPPPDLSLPVMEQPDLAMPATSPDLGTTPPATVSIQVIGATVGLAEANGNYWDGFGTVDPSVIAQQTAALASNTPYESVVAVISANAAGGTGPPDPYGTATLYYSGAWTQMITLVAAGNEQMNTYFPLFPGPPGWQQVPLAPDLKFSVHLLDEDVIGSEEIGTVEIGLPAIMDALAAGTTWEVFTGDQSQNQLLFVAITVVPD
jgi:hypothetical protein